LCRSTLVPGKLLHIDRELCRAALCVCLCLCVFVCVLSSRCLVCRPSHLCVCRVGTPLPLLPLRRGGGALIYIDALYLDIRATRGQSRGRPKSSRGWTETSRRQTPPVQAPKPPQTYALSPRSLPACTRAVSASRSQSHPLPHPHPSHSPSTPQGGSGQIVDTSERETRGTSRSRGRPFI
jgi:hypothetical protein